ncbi:hypothetical protein [Mycobacterium sp. IDR2000157661]|uniref:hypothetical protein n=1 Tax=Mycobacterium sp. IDR2000157661 TaxID=2867005 RepID=UPI001EE9CE29|nr:hypothetical protein [Mycobacterium sp. IDR2000157661]ULE34387.1 hypothetical protein K3G64_07055 [Mycobacterium sp. IDR2000157661]
MALQTRALQTRALQTRRRQIVFAVAFVGLLGGGSAAAVAAQPNQAPQGVAQICPNSMTDSIWIAGCLPSIDPPPQYVDERGPDQLPALYGIPCSGNDCLGLSRALNP